MSSSCPSTAPRTQKRLLFDRRYGWVFDEWRDPSEEALAAGRGMFCILPLAKALVNTASRSISFAAGSVVEVLKRPDQVSPQALKASLDDQIQKLMSIERPNLNLFIFKGNSSIQSGGMQPENGVSDNSCIDYPGTVAGVSRK